MTINPIEGRGVHRAECVCDECARTEVVTCNYEKASSGKWVPNEGQIKTKITAHNWTIVKGKMFCPKCTAKRKTVSMQASNAKKAEAPAPSRPSKKQRIQIFTMLADVYDVDAGRYMQGDTDDTVAEVLGVMPGWVVEIREEEFGPDGGNEDIEKLAAELAEFREQATAAIKANTEQNDKMIKALDKVKDFAAVLDRIKKAVGPRNQKKAGI